MKVKSDTNLHHELCEACYQHTPDKQVAMQHIPQLMRTFTRKYTHARIQGFIKGEYNRKSEKAGSRSKGGANLRDHLYNVSNVTMKPRKSVLPRKKVSRKSK